MAATHSSKTRVKAISESKHLYAPAEKKPIAFRQMLGLIFEPNSLQVKTERHKGKAWTGELVSYRLNEKIQRKKGVQSFDTLIQFNGQ